LSNTTLFDGTGMYRIHYIKYNYMFRRFTMAIFKLYMKCLESSYTRLIMGFFFHPVLSQSVHGTATYRCDDTRDCITQFCPPDDQHMCSKHVEA